MFCLQKTNGDKCRSKNNSLQDIQYELCGSYIRYASEKLAIKQAELMAQTTILLQKIDFSSDQKSLTQAATTQASIVNYCCSEDPSSLKQRQKKTAFKRKSKYADDRRAKCNIADSLQEIKEVCTERTIYIAQQIFTEYQRLSDGQQINDFRKIGKLSKKTIKRRYVFKQRCKVQLFVDSLQIKTQRYEEKIISLNIEIHRLQMKCQQLENQANKLKISQTDSIERNKTLLSNCKQFLHEKQTSLFNRSTELKALQQNICSSLQKVARAKGCQRCEMIHSIKAQILSYRKYYEKECELLQKLFMKYRKMLR